MACQQSLSILLEVGASQQIIDEFEIQEIDIYALMLMDQEHFDELGLEGNMFYLVQQALNSHFVNSRLFIDVQPTN